MDIYSSLKILVIEDNHMFRNLALRMLPNCKKRSAVTAKEGLKLFKDLAPDITFLDIGLPDKNGLELLKTLKDINPDAFIVMLTQSRVLSDVDTAVKYGAAGYIAKPFSQKEIESYIKLYFILVQDEKQPESSGTPKNSGSSNQRIQP